MSNILFHVKFCDVNVNLSDLFLCELYFDNCLVYQNDWCTKENWSKNSGRANLQYRNLTARLNEQATNQATTVEILRYMQEELREKRGEVRGEEEGGVNPITKVLGEFRKPNPSSFVGSHNPVEAQN